MIMMIFNISTSYFHKNSFHYLENNLIKFGYALDMKVEK